MEIKEINGFVVINGKHFMHYIEQNGERQLRNADIDTLEEMISLLVHHRNFLIYSKRNKSHLTRIK